MDEGVAYYIPLSEIEEATENFSKKIGKGSFGPVYYGRLRDGKEVAVKTMADSSSHGTKQFATEVYCGCYALVTISMRHKISFLYQGYALHDELRATFTEIKP